jgi:hypothetical protein
MMNIAKWKPNTATVSWSSMLDSKRRWLRNRAR